VCVSAEQRRYCTLLSVLLVHMFVLTPEKLEVLFGIYIIVYYLSLYINAITVVVIILNETVSEACRTAQGGRQF